MVIGMSLIGDRRDFFRNREDDVEVRHRQ
jgi:hypothetical protein